MRINIIIIRKMMKIIRIIIKKGQKSIEIR